MSNPVNSDLDGIGNVITPVTFRKSGRIQLNGRWWFARSVYDETILPGSQVIVRGRSRNLLFVIELIE